MKRTYRGLSLEIKEKPEKFVIIVQDKEGYKQGYEASKADRNEKIRILAEAKNWLWNMGDYNGQANEMMRKYHLEWEQLLGLQ